jgi:hypothetical protein
MSFHDGPPRRADQGETTLMRTILGGAVLAVIAGLLAIVGPSLGITTLWPVLLAAAVALAAGPAVASRTGAFALGAIMGIVAMGIRAGFLPDVPTSAAIIVVLAIAILTAIAALSQGLLPLWASLAGYAAFVGYYTPTYSDSPTTFVADAPVALVTVLLAAGIGAIVAIVAELVGVGVARNEDRHVGAGEVV